MSATPAATSEAEGEEREIPVELQLDLPSFEGPMDLLLELVRNREVDIFEIPVALITEEYLACIERMEDLDLEVGGDWLEMAARLMYIKSRTLLPDDDEDDHEDDGPDPREELVRQLIEYERYKKYAEQLEAAPTLGHEVFESTSTLDQFRREAGPPEIRDAELSDLVDAVRRIIASTEETEEFVYEMTREKLSLRSVILDVASMLDESPRITFDAIFAGGSPSRNHVITAFIGLLEMARLDMITLFQARLGEVDQLFIERAVIDIVEVTQTLDLSEEPQAEEGTAPATRP